MEQIRAMVEGPTVVLSIGVKFRLERMLEELRTPDVPQADEE